ncbi:MAG TPA: hypothetical protein VFS43_00165 [Polyangiaceae bacterium]|nr:hypothetical protein [Polyangiaceae bacterium]
MAAARPPRRNAARPAGGWAGEADAERAASGRPHVKLTLPASVWALAPVIAERLGLPGGAERGRSLAVALALAELAAEVEGASKARRAELRALAEPFVAPNAKKSSKATGAAKPRAKR